MKSNSRNNVKPQGGQERYKPANLTFDSGLQSQHAKNPAAAILSGNVSDDEPSCLESPERRYIMQAQA